MSAPNDGGPAFPICDCSQNHATGATTSHQYIYSGMSMRDKFAESALPAVIACCSGDTRRPSEGQADYFARVCYELADAMLRAREVKS